MNKTTIYFCLNFVCLCLFSALTITACGSNGENRPVESEETVVIDNKPGHPELDRVPGHLMKKLLTMNECIDEKVVLNFKMPTKVLDRSYEEDWVKYVTAELIIVPDVGYELEVQTIKQCYDYRKCPFCNTAESCRDPVKEYEYFASTVETLDKNIHLHNLGYVEGFSNQLVSIDLKAKEANLLGINNTEILLFPTTKNCN